MNYPKYLFYRLIGVDIVKVFSLNAMATLVRMLTGMISVKVVAVIIGPSGIALLGQLSNFNAILLNMANGGINSGITKYVAEYKEDNSSIKKYISNALHITAICSFIVSLIMIFGCVYLSRLILLNDEYYYVFIVFGFTIFLYTLNGLFVSILNGYKHFKKYVKVNICGTILGLLYSIALVTTLGLSGALINAVTYQSIVFFITLYMCRKEHWFNLDYFREKFDVNIIRKYLGFSAMTLTAMALFPIYQLFLRGYVISQISATDAGIWEGMNRISSMYLGVITTAFGVYYLPRLSEIKDTVGLHNELFHCYKYMVPLLLLIGCVVFSLRHFILWLLFTPDFYPMENLFIWQLCGDFFKITSWMLAYIMVAKAKAKVFIVTEIVFSSTYFLISYLLVRINGIVGLTQGYFINYIIYMIAMCVYFRNILIPNKL